MSHAATAVGDDMLLFANDDWAVTAEGLEHRGTGYFIPREEVGHRRSDGLWTWPVHMAEKLWCAPAGFAEAFMQAVRAYGLEADAGLALAFHDAGRMKGEQTDHGTRDASRINSAQTGHGSQDAGRAKGGQTGQGAPDTPSPAGRWRPDDARSATAHPWRPSRVAQAGLTLLQWLRQHANGR
jgi:hypothetical protein